MTEDLKLFGEVGLGYSQLQKDVEEINNLVTSVDKNLGKLSGDLEKNNISVNVKFDPNSAKQINDLSAAIKHIENTSTTANKAVMNMTSDLNKIGGATVRAKKEFETMTSAVEKFNKSGALKNPFEGIINTDIKSTAKELESYFNEINKVTTKSFNVENLGKAINDELRFAAKGTDEFNRALEMSGKYSDYANSKLGELKTQLQSVRDAMKKATDADTLKKEFLAKNPLSEADFSKMTESIGATVEKKARSSAIKYVDEFGRTIRETWQKKSGSFFPSTQKIISDPLKKQEAEINATVKRGERVLEANINRRRQVEKTAHNEKMAELKKEQDALENGDKHFNPSKVRNLGQTVSELYAVKRILQETVKVAADFQEKQIEVERIAQNNVKDAKELKQSIFDIAKETGTMVGDVQEVAGLWARTGKSGEQLKEAVKTTMMGFNVADFKDAETAVASINGIVNQMYNGDATKSQSILDSLVKVADKTAVRNVEDLAEVASRAGANAKSLKMDLHELNAVSSIVMENMKVDGNVLGTQLKSVFAYMMNDGRMKKLEKFGVEMTKNNENGTKSLKSFSEAFGDVVKKYREFMASGDEKRANDLLSTIGGTRFTPMIKNLADNWEKFESRVALSKDSAGFAAEQNEKKMESLNKQIQALKASATELLVSIGESGILQSITGITKGFKSFIDMLNKIPGAVTMVIPTITALHVALTTLALKAKIGLRDDSLLYYLVHGLDVVDGKFRLPGLKDGIDKLRGLKNEAHLAGTAMSVAGTGMAKAGKEAADMASDVGKAGEAVKTAEGATKEMAGAAVSGGSALAGLKAAFSSAKAGVASLVAGITASQAAFAAVAVAIAAAGAALVYMKKKNDELLNNTISGKFDKEIEDIENMHDAYMKIQNDTEAFKEGTDAHEQLVDVQGRLAEALGVSKEAYSAEASTIGETNKVIEARIALKKSEIAAEKEKGIEQAKNFLNRADKHLGFDYQNESLVHNAERVRQAMSLLETTSKKVDDLRKKGADNKQIEAALKNQENALTAVRENYEKLLPVYEKVKQAGDALGKPGAADEILEKHNYGDLIETVASKLKEKADASEEAAEGSDKHAASMEAELDQLKEMSDECDKYISKVNAMDSARKEYNETGELSISTVSGLISKYPELAECITKVGDKYLLNKNFLDEYTKSTDSQVESLDAMIAQAREFNRNSTDLTMGGIADTIDTQAMDDFMYKLRELDSEVYNTVSNLNEQFLNGSIGPEEFFRKLKDSINNIDLTKLSTTDIQNFSNAIQTYLTSSVQSLDSQLQSGEITRAKYDSQLREIRQKALDLYTALNGLSYVDGSWVDSNGKVDKYANSLQKLIGNTNKTKKEMDDAKDSVDDFNDSLSEVGDIEIDLSGFTEGFTNAFEEIREGLGQAYEDIMDDSDGYTDVLLDNFWSILDGVSASGQTAISSLATAVGSMFEGLVKSTTDSGNQTLGVVGNIASSLGRTTFSFMAHSKLGNLLDFTLGNLLGSPLKGLLLSSFGFVFGGKGKARTADMTGGKVRSRTTSSGGSRSRLPSFLTTERFNKLGHETSKGKPSTGRSFSKLFNKLFEVQDTFPAQARRQKRKNRSNSSSSKSSKSSGSKSKGGSQDRLDRDTPDSDVLPRDHSGSGGGGGGKGKGGGGGGKGSSSKQDIPEKVQKQIDSLRHKLDMDEMDQYQYAKEIEKILSKNKSILTEKGIREIEKMVYDAKKGGVRDGFKAHIDELKNLNELAEQTIQSLESEKQMIDALNLNPSLKLGINQDLSEVYSGKLIVSLSMVRKYQLAIEEIDKELKSLNSSSVGYSKTVEELNKVKDEYIKKLREEEEAVTKAKDATAKLAMEQYKIKQFKIDKAIENLEHINQLTIQMINGRNEKIKERVQERHRAEMEALEKENDAKNKAHRKQMDRMQREADAFRRYMEDKMKALNRENAKEDYEDTVKKKEEEIVELKNRIDLVSLDDSYKAKGEVIKLKKTLNDKQDELDKIRRDRSRTLAQEGLQDQLTDYERQLQGKQDLMNKEVEFEEEKNNNALELLRKRQEAEMKALEETMTARAVAAEAEIAIKTGVVKNIDGLSIDLKMAIIKHMQEIGEWSGILSGKMITDFNAAYNQINNTLQLLGLGGKSSFGPLQQQLGLTDESYTAWKQDVSHKTGVAFEDVEEYIQNKMAWGSASPEARKYLERANHLIRKKIVDSHGGDQSYNKDKNGLVYGLELLPSRDDKRWEFVQPSPRFAVHPGMTREGSEKLFNYQTAMGLYPEKSSQIMGDVRTLRQYEPSASNYDLSYVVGNKFANDINKIGKSNSILDVPADQLELDELRKIIQNERSGLNGGSGGYSGSGPVDYNRMVDDIMGGASQKKKDFIKKILPKAMEVSKKYNLPLAAILGQAIEESGWGSGSSLFGIKNAGGSGYKQHGSWDEAIEYYGHMMSGMGGNGLWAKKQLQGISDPRQYLSKMQDRSIGGFDYCSTPAGDKYTNAVMGVIEANNLMGFQNANVDRYRTGGYGSGDGGARERLLAEAHKQDGMPYSMGPERATTHRDCSSYVYFATKNSGLYSGNMFYTGNMRAELAKDGWQDLGQIPKDQIRRGDIFWYVGGGVHHTEIATEDGTLKTTGAHRKGKPAGPSSWTYNYHILRHPSLNPFKNGGIADFTGPAMLHGTKANPEYIFNAPQFDALGKIVAKYATAPSVYAPRDLTSTYDPVVNVQVDNLVQINGNATKETAQEIKDASTDVLKNLEKALRKRGK